jgi:hypothetical protein
MKYIAMIGMVLLVAAPGCVTLPGMQAEDPPKAVVEKVKEKPAAPQQPPVNPEDIDATNASKKAAELQNELDRAQSSDSSADERPVKVRQ